MATITAQRPIGQNEMAGRCAVCEIKAPEVIAGDGRAMCAGCAASRGGGVVRELPKAA